jgi:hypothetical protein
MMFWWFDPELNGGVAGREFATMDQMFALDGELISKAPLSRVLRVEREGRNYYVKRYTGNGKNARRLRFYLDYTGHDRLSAGDRKHVRRIVGFFEGRE